MRIPPLRHLPILLALVLSTAALAVSLGLATPQKASENTVASAQFTAEETRDIARIAHDYLLEHPEVIRDAIQALQAKEEAAKADLQMKAVTAYKDQIFADAAAPTAGNPVGDVTIVEFFDYKCPYCKQVAPALEALLQADKGLKLVFKEFPILGDPSVLAARAALAAAKQDRYLALHQAMMAYRGDLDLTSIATMAAEAGLDAEKLVADMKSEEIAKQLTANHELAVALSIRSTPTFIIGDKVIPGALSIERLRDLITDYRKGS